MAGFTPAVKGAQDVDVVASDVPIITDTSTKSTSSTTYVKVTTIGVPASLTRGTIRTVFTLKSSATGTAAYGIIRINGVDAGTERTTTEITYQTYTEDIAVNKETDTIELWLKHASHNAFSTKLRIEGDVENIDPNWEVI